MRRNENSGGPGFRPARAVAAVFLALAAFCLQPALAQTTRTGSSGLPVPRFVSLKSDRVNVRKGPTQEHEVAWTFVRAGLPVEIVQEFDTWRRIRDWEGGEGWVFHSLLSGKRTGLVTPWESEARTPLRASADSDGRIVAELSPNVLVDVEKCDGGWCRVSGPGFNGWVDQTRLFGIYPDEKIE
ncbi:aspartyl-trna synthetase [Stappia sp. F7233]|uniref:Aspartyl-trna synthetase n=1 Tax=Stappia albiluteola TaxID=2758565 RepID=A0A839AJ11_9HYPH|nr:SH3 domain-containing protein [Stappia albiluteola]MBA5778902.1 aspartyl-trna synthetase [Stappia albiluteola]